MFCMFLDSCISSLTNISAADEAETEIVTGIETVTERGIGTGAEIGIGIREGKYKGKLRGRAEIDTGVGKF